MGHILVTGATGNVGREVVRELAARGAGVRAAVFDGADAARLPDGVNEATRFDFTDPTTYAAAFDGVDRLFLMRPPAISNIKRDMRPALEYAVAHGVRHVVFLSLLGAERNPILPHAKVEKLLMASGAAWTMLRCGFFMQNLSSTRLADIREHDDLFIPAGGGKTSFIDVRDIGAVAAKILVEVGVEEADSPEETEAMPHSLREKSGEGAGHAGQAYPLTGSVALGYDEVAAIMTEELGRPITYSDPSPRAFARRLRQRSYPSGFVNVTAVIYLTTRLGMAAAVHPDAARLLGRPPITMRQFVRDYAAVFKEERETSKLADGTAGKEAGAEAQGRQGEN